MGNIIKCFYSELIEYDNESKALKIPGYVVIDVGLISINYTYTYVNDINKYEVGELFKDHYVKKIVHLSKIIDYQKIIPNYIIDFSDDLKSIYLKEYIIGIGENIKEGSLKDDDEENRIRQIVNKYPDHNKQSFQEDLMRLSI